MNPPTPDVLTTNLRIDELELGVFSPRKQFSPAYIEELAEDMKREGQLKPILVRLHPKELDRYQVIDGEHRVRALKRLGMSTVRAEVRRLSDEEADFLAMQINLMHGKRLSQLEEALHVKKLTKRYGYTQQKVAELYNRSQQWVSDRFKLVNSSSEALLNAFTTRVVDMSKARKIAQLPKGEQPEVVKKVADASLSARQTEVLVHALKEVETPKEKQRILDKPIETLLQLYKEPEAAKRLLKAAPEEAVYQFVDCPICGKRIWIDWIERAINWGTPEQHLQRLEQQYPKDLLNLVAMKNPEAKALNTLIVELTNLLWQVACDFPEVRAEVERRFLE